jgi:hypothetical protein
MGSVTLVRWLAAASLALAAGAFASLAPALALIVCPLAFAVIDARLAPTVDVPHPSLRVRLLARVPLSVAWLSAAAAAITLAGHAAATRLAPWLVPMMAIGLAIGGIASALYGALGPTPKGREIIAAWRYRMIDAPLVALLDAVVMLFCAIAAMALAGRTRPVDRATSAMVLGGVVLARSGVVLAVGVALKAAWTRGGRGLGAFVGASFVGWIGAASLAASFADHRIGWSGMGAAIALSAASVLAEARGRRKSPIAALARATFAWSVAAFVGLLAIPMPP